MLVNRTTHSSAGQASVGGVGGTKYSTSARMPACCVVIRLYPAPWRHS